MQIRKALLHPVAKPLLFLVALLPLHFFWMRAGKNNFAEVAVYATVIAMLLGWRVAQALRLRAAGAPGASGRPASRARG